MSRIKHLLVFVAAIWSTAAFTAAVVLWEGPEEKTPVPDEIAPQRFLASSP